MKLFSEIRMRVCRAAFALIIILSSAVNVGFADAPLTAGEIILETVEFKQALVRDAVRTVSELTGINIVATVEAGDKPVTFFVRNASVADVVDSLCRISGLWYRFNQETGIYLIMTAAEYQKDIVVFRNEPVRIFQLKYLNVGVASRTIADLFGERVELLGRVNRQLGDDYRLGKPGDDAVFLEDFDNGDIDDSGGYGSSSNSSGYGNSGRRSSRSSSSSSSSNSRYRNQNQRNEEVRGLGNVTLTPEQLARLEASASGSPLVAEGDVGQIVQRTEAAPIYVTVNRMHNMLLVRTSDEKAMEEIARIVKESDRQVPEVLLEMKVLEVQLSNQFKSAFDLSGLTGSEQPGPNDGQPANPLNLSARTARSTVLGLGNGGIQEGSSMIFQVLSGNLRARMQLLEQNNNIRTLATPMLLAANNHPARLFVGNEAIITTGFETQASGVEASGNNLVVNTLPIPITEVRSVGDTLSILPSINADRSVVMRIVHENSSILPAGGSVPVLTGSRIENVPIDTVNTARLEGTVLAMDGMTVAIGGMMRTSNVDNQTKVPLLGDAPVFGFFFKRKAQSEIKTELVLLITPHVISAPEDAEAVSNRRMNATIDHPSELDIYLNYVDPDHVEP